MNIRAYDDPDRAAVIALWNEVFPNPAPYNDPALVIDQKRRADDGLFFVTCEESKVIGTVVGGYDGRRGWVYTLAVAPGMRRNGVGRSLMQHLEDELRKRGCRKVNLQVRGGNEAVRALYEQMGFSVEDRVIGGGAPQFNAVVRIADEDLPKLFPANIRLEMPAPTSDWTRFFILRSTPTNAESPSSIISHREPIEFSPRISTVKAYISFKSTQKGRCGLAGIEEYQYVREKIANSRWQFMRSRTVHRCVLCRRTVSPPVGKRRYLSTITERDSKWEPQGAAVGLTIGASLDFSSASLAYGG